MNWLAPLFAKGARLSQLEIRALSMWRDREMQYPAFVRRMQPDQMDGESGAWALMLDKAEKEARR